MTLFTEMQDLEAAIGALRGHPQIDKENLFLFGASQGGLVTAMTAARHADETRGIVLLFPALCIAGGGANNTYLNELTERAIGRPVVTGSPEATALGNILLQEAAYV